MWECGERHPIRVLSKGDRKTKRKKETLPKNRIPFSSKESLQYFSVLLWHISLPIRCILSVSLMSQKVGGSETLLHSGTTWAS